MEFEYKTLAELSIDGKGKYGIGASAVDFHEDLPTYLRITDITEDGNLTREGLKSIDHPDSKKYILRKNDIVFARTGNSTGKSYFYNEKDGELVYAGFLIKFSINPQKINPRYIKYFTLTNEYRGWVQSNFTGSTRPNINAQGYGKLLIPVIPRKQQDNLVRILSTIDEKIGVNNETIANLEELSRTLFKRWFVDFEFPNESGAPFKSSGGAMKESELGAIPFNWSVQTVNEISKINKKNLSKNRELSYINYLDTGSITNNLISSSKYIDLSNEKLPSRAKRIVNENDIVYSTVRPNQRHYGLLKTIEDNMIVSTGFAVITCEIENYDEILYLWLTQEEIINQLQTLAEHSTSAYPSISPKDIGKIKVLLPQEHELEEFNFHFIKYYDQISILQNENNHLAKLRDTLLPKLMSGEIELPDDLEVEDHAELLQ